ncbi:MAG: hypothetical protein ACRDGS_14165 [Chloroflexota bacterium]
MRIAAACGCGALGQLAAENVIAWIPSLVAIPFFIAGALLLYSCSKTVGV